MKSFLRWLWTGFGTHTTAYRGIGMAICTLMIGIIAVYYVIRGTVRLFQKNRNQAALD